jgi:cell division protein FtsQ
MRGASPLPEKKPPRELRLDLSFPSWMGPLLMVSLLVGAVGYGVNALYRHWPVTEVELLGRLTHVDSEQLAQQLLWVRDESFFSLDIGKVQKQVLAFPMVERVSVRKQWPGVLQLAIHEALPVAFWNGEQVLTSSGQLMAVPAGLDTSRLMKLSGEYPATKEAVRYYRRIRQALDNRTAGHIHNASDGNTGSVAIGIEIMTVSALHSVDIRLTNGWNVRFGRQDFDQRLQRLMTLLDTLSAQRVEQVDLRYGNAAAIRWHKTGEMG